MKKFLPAAIDLLFLAIIWGLSYLHYALGFCNMRGPHEWDMCDAYGYSELYTKAIFILVSLALLLDLIFVLCSIPHRSITSKIRTTGMILLFVYTAGWMLAMNY